MAKSIPNWSSKGAKKEVGDPRSHIIPDLPWKSEEAMSRTWKQIELKIAKVFGGKRAGPVGKDGPDVIECDPFAIQVKHGKQIPATIQKFMDQTVRDAPKGTLPTLIMHPYGRSIGESLVVFRLSDFREWYLDE